MRRLVTYGKVVERPSYRLGQCASVLSADKPDSRTLPHLGRRGCLTTDDTPMLKVNTMGTPI